MVLEKPLRLQEYKEQQPKPQRLCVALNLNNQSAPSEFSVDSVAAGFH